MHFRRSLLAGLAVAGLLLSAVAAQASPVTLTFFNISSNSGADAPLVAQQLSVVVSEVSATQTNFVFRNDGNVASSITDIYFDDRTPATLLSLASINNTSAGVSFSSPATPANLPGGNTASPAFVTTGTLSADSDAGPGGVSSNGVNNNTGAPGTGEFVGLLFNNQVGTTFANIVAGLTDGTLRIGLHVQSIGTGGKSDGFVNNPVPEPGFYGLLSLCLGGLYWIRRRQISGPAVESRTAPLA